MAVIGDKKDTGYMWLRSLSTFQGKVYSVQVDPNELPGIESLGVQKYYSLLDIPDAVDYVIVAVPRTVVIKVVSDCIEKKVGGATLFTSGFSGRTSSSFNIREEYWWIDWLLVGGCAAT